jgi:hypothetical protein
MASHDFDSLFLKKYFKILFELHLLEMFCSFVLLLALYCCHHGVPAFIWNLFVSSVSGNWKNCTI